MRERPTAVFPVAEELLLRRLSFAFTTGYGSDGIQEIFKTFRVLLTSTRCFSLRSKLMPLLAPVAAWCRAFTGWSVLGRLPDGLANGAAAAFIAEEALFGRDTSALFEWIKGQPAWSDLPFIVLTSRPEQPGVIPWRRQLIAALRNVSLLERPVQSMTLVSTVQAALRARSRQLELEALLEEREQASQVLERLVAARTQELKAANEALRDQMASRALVEEKLRQAQKIEAIGQLTGGIAHDFNNLLMVISGGLEMLDRQTDPARRKRMMDGMRQAAERGSGLTRQLLAFSRRQELKPQTVDLERQIGGMRELLD